MHHTVVEAAAVAAVASTATETDAGFLRKNKSRLLSAAPPPVQMCAYISSRVEYRLWSWETGGQDNDDDASASPAAAGFFRVSSYLVSIIKPRSSSLAHQASFVESRARLVSLCITLPYIGRRQRIAFSPDLVTN